MKKLFFTVKSAASFTLSALRCNGERAHAPGARRERCLLALALALSLQPLAFAGTNASLTYRTNDWLIQPTGIWASNAAAIQAVVGAGGGGTTNIYYPLQIATNGSGQIYIYGLSAQVLSNTIALSNLNAALAALGSNNGANLTNVPDAALQTAPLTDPTRFIAATNGNGATLTNVQTTAFIGTLALSNLPAALATVGSNNAVNLTNVQASSITGQIADANLPTNALTNGSVFLAATNPSTAGNLTMATPNSSIGWPDSSESINESAGGFQFWSTTGEVTIDSAGDIIPTGSFKGHLDATNLTGGPVPYSVLPAGIVTNSNTAPASLLLSNNSFAGTNQWTGDVAYPWAFTSSLVTGNNTISAGAGPAVDVSGPSGPFSLCSITGGQRDGRVLWLRNRTGWAWTIANNSGFDPNPADRILTGQGADLALSNNPSIISLVYSGVDSRWHLQSMNAASSGIVSASLNTELGFTTFAPNSRNREMQLYSIPLGAKTMAAVGDSFSVGTGASPNTLGFAYLIAASNNLTLNNYGASGHAVADMWPEVSNVVYGSQNPLVTFEVENNNQSTGNTDFNNGLTGLLTLLELGTNFLAGTNLSVISGTWSNTASSLGTAQQQTPCYGVISTVGGSAVSNEVAGKTIIVGALNFAGTTNTGGSFSVTIDGAPVGTNYLTNSFHSTFGLAYEPCAFYYPNYAEGLHTVVITNLGTGNVAIEYIATPEMALNPPVIEVFNNLPATNWTSNGLSVTMASINARNQSFQQVCDLLDYAQFPVALVDVYGAFMGALGTNGCGNFYNTNLYWDVIHPGPGGHLLYAQTALRQIARPSRMAFPDIGMSIHTDGNSIQLDESAATSSFPSVAIKGSSGIVFYVEPNGWGQFGNGQITFDQSGNLTATSFGTPGKGSFTNGIASLATNNAAPASTSGITNTNGVTWVYDVTGTNVTIAQFDNKTNWWDTNTAFTGSKEFVIQPGGGWTNSGTVTITGGHAF